MEIPPNTIFFLTPTLHVQPDRAEAPTAVTAVRGCNHTLPFGAATDCVNRPEPSVTTEEAAACTYKGSGPPLVQMCHEKDYK